MAEAVTQQGSQGSQGSPELEPVKQMEEMILFLKPALSYGDSTSVAKWAHTPSQADEDVLEHLVDLIGLGVTEMTEMVCGMELLSFVEQMAACGMEECAFEKDNEPAKSIPTFCKILAEGSAVEDFWAFNLRSTPGLREGTGNFKAAEEIPLTSAFKDWLLITMGSGSSAQAYQLTAEEAAGAHNSEKLQEEVAQLKEEAPVRSLRQAEAAAARRIEELERRLREAAAQNFQEPESRPPQEEKSVEQLSSLGGTISPAELMTKADIEEPHLYFTLQDKPAILEKTADIPYHGHIKGEEGLDCYVSFPGKYAAGWDALIKEHHGQSVACVFLCTPADGLGKHHKGPDGDCYCHTIYGQRDFRTFGYLKELPSHYSQAAVEIEVEKAKATNTVVVRADSTKEAKQIAEVEAETAWEKSGRVASWGCQCSTSGRSRWRKP
eukprot:s2125_g11.t1